MSRYRKFCAFRVFALFVVRFSVTLFVAIIFTSSATAAQSSDLFAPVVTPSSLAVLVGQSATLSFNDASGQPLGNAKWSIDPPIADLQPEKGHILLTPKQPGRAVITATNDAWSASATISILAGERLPPATVHWSVLPTRGYETLQILQATDISESPGDPEKHVAFYSIEWNSSSNAILRSFKNSGEQLWSKRLSSSASPTTLKNNLPQTGEIFLNDQRVNDHAQFIIGDKSAFSIDSGTNPSAFGMPPDGKSILLRVSGADDGGIVILERSRFRDSLVSLGSSNGAESWTYRSQGRLNKNWTVHYSGNIAIVETLRSPASSRLILLNGKTGEIQLRVPIPISTSTINGFRCQDPRHNILKSVSASPTGSVFTSTDTNIYMQADVHIESEDLENCQAKHYSYDDSLMLLRVTPDGQPEWKTFHQVHADGTGSFQVQIRLFPGESIPDGYGGVLAAWTSLDPHPKPDKSLNAQAWVSRLSDLRQRDFPLPLIFWTPGINSLFDENMLLGESNALYATNGPLLIRFDTEAGKLDWSRHPPNGSVRLHHSTTGDGVLISNDGKLISFDSQGNGTEISWTVPVAKAEDIGLAQSDLFQRTPLPPICLRDLEITYANKFLAVADGAPYGNGSILSFDPR